MTEISRFQAMSGCSACKHAAEADEKGVLAVNLGASFWCRVFDKAVQTKDGATCERWEN